MDSLKARALALALPAALGLFISGSAVESHAADNYPFDNQTQSQVADRDPFGSMATPSSLNFVQRFPAIESESAAAQLPQLIDDEQTLRRFVTIPAANVTPDQSPEAATPKAATPTPVMEPVRERVASYQPPRNHSYMVSREQEAVEFQAPIQLHTQAHTQPAQQSHSISQQAIQLGPQTVESIPQKATRTFTPVVSVATDRFSNPVVTSVGTGVVESAVEQFGEWDNNVCNTPPLHRPVSQLQLNEDEPIIHVLNREPDPALKRQFYDQQFAAAEIESQEAMESPVLDLSPAAEAAVQEDADRAGQMMLRQPGNAAEDTEFVISDGNELVESNELDPRVARLEESVLQEATNAARGIDIADAGDERGAWDPVDMRKVSIDRPLKEDAARQASQATVADKAQAQRAVQLGFELIQRQAHYSARARFIQALRIVARSMDDQTFTTAQSGALRNALAAYEESVDFYPAADKPDEDVNLHMILGGHNTPVLADIDTSRLTPRQCVREYMAYAEQEFVAALGHDGFASQALYGLGRLEASKETASASAPQVRANRSLMLYQTAMLVDPRNYAAANELGVLLAKYGKFDTAVAALQHCVLHSPEPTAWRNLANLYRRMGRPAEAHMAEREANNVRARRGGAPFVANQPRVEWVGPEAFMAMNANTNVQVAQSARGQVSPPPNQRQRPTRESVARNRTPSKSAGKSTRKSFWPFKKK